VIADRTFAAIFLYNFIVSLIQIEIHINLVFQMHEPTFPDISSEQRPEKLSHNNFLTIFYMRQRRDDKTIPSRL